MASGKDKLACSVIGSISQEEIWAPAFLWTKSLAFISWKNPLLNNFRSKWNRIDCTSYFRLDKFCWLFWIYYCWVELIMTEILEAFNNWLNLSFWILSGILNKSFEFCFVYAICQFFLIESNFITVIRKTFFLLTIWLVALFSWPRFSYISLTSKFYINLLFILEKFEAIIRVLL